MVQPIHQTISGHEYEITPFLGMVGLRMQTRLLKMLGPSIKAALGAFEVPPKGKSILDAKIDPGAIGAAIEGLGNSLMENDPTGKFTAELLSQTKRDGRALTETVINEVYSANYVEMMNAVFAVVVANGFFGLSATTLGGINGLVAQMQEVVKEKPDLTKAS